MDYQAVFSRLPDLTPPRTLSAQILARIQTERAHVARIRLTVFSFATLCSLLAFVPVLRYASEEFSRSGFIAYASLLFSDGGSITLFWREFALSLIESLPVFGLAAVFATLLVFLGSLRLIAKNLHTAFLSPRLA